MTFGAAIKHGFRNLTNFKGRARRSEFWWFYLLVTLISIPLTFLAMVPFFATWFDIMASQDVRTGDLQEEQLAELVGAAGVMYLLSFLFGAVTFFLILAVWVRRLHDAGYSGHWLWFNLAGLGIVPLIFAFFDSKWGPNEWGEDPKAAERGAWPAVQQPQAYAAPGYAAPSYAGPDAPNYPPPIQPLPNAPVATQPPPASAIPHDPFAGPPQ